MGAWHDGIERMSNDCRSTIWTRNGSGEIAWVVAGKVGLSEQMWLYTEGNNYTYKVVLVLQQSTF